MISFMPFPKRRVLRSGIPDLAEKRAKHAGALERGAETSSGDGGIGEIELESAACSRSVYYSISGRIAGGSAGPGRCQKRPPPPPGSPGTGAIGWTHAYFVRASL